MTGIVTTHREAIPRLALHDANGQEHCYDSLVDTGYNGNLTLPPNAIATLGLNWFRFGHAVLADGNAITFSIYKGVVLWMVSP